MQNEWILDVLADLRNFARQNGLSILAEQLDDTRLLAATELASKAEGLLGNDEACAGAARYNTVPVGGRPGTRHASGDH